LTGGPVLENTVLHGSVTSIARLGEASFAKIVGGWQA